MNSFKEGDSVFCINTGNDGNGVDGRFSGDTCGSLTAGKRYTVDSTLGDYVRVFDDSGILSGWHYARFDNWQNDEQVKEKEEGNPVEVYTREDLHFALEMHQISNITDSLCSMIATKKAFEKIKDNEDFQKFMFELSSAGSAANNVIKELAKEFK